MPADASQIGRRRRGDRRPDVRAGGPARNREVADHHQPAGPGDRRRPTGCCSSPRSGPRSTWSPAGWTPSGSGRSASTCTTSPVSQRLSASQITGCARSPGRGRRTGAGGDRRGPASGPRPTGPVRHPVARAERVPGCRSTRRGRRVLSIGDDAPRLPIPRRAAGCRADRRLWPALRRSLTTVGDVAAPAGPRPDHPWAFVDAPDVDVAAVRAAAIEFDAAVRRPAPGRRPLADALQAVRGPADLAALTGAHRSVRCRRRRAGRNPFRPLASGHRRGDRRSSPPSLPTAHPGAGRGDPGGDRPAAGRPAAQARAAAESSWFGRKKRLHGGARSAGRCPAAGRRGRARARCPTWSPRCVQVQGAVRGLAAQADGDPRRLRPGRLESADRAGRQQVDRPDRTGCGGREPPSIPGHAPTEFVTRLCGGGSPLRNRCRHRTGRRCCDARSALIALVNACAGAADAVARMGRRRRAFRPLAETAVGSGLGDPELASLRRWLALLSALEPLRAAGADAARVAAVGRGAGRRRCPRLRRRRGRRVRRRAPGQRPASPASTP